MATFKSLLQSFLKEKQTAGRIVPHNNDRKEFVIIGLGRFGASLAATLHNYGHSVLAMDADMRLVQRLSKELPHVVQMDATNKEGYVELGVGNFDTALICVGSDFEVNMLATVILRQIGVKRIICKAMTRTQKDILLKIGADEVILPEHEAGVRLGQRLAATGFVDYMAVNEEISVVEMKAPANVIGKSLMESQLRQKYHLVVVAIRRTDSVIVLPRADEVILQDDILVVLGRPGDCESVVGK
jgi:trk system potassium uptake protein TrkA